MEVFLKPKNIIVLGGGSGIGFAAAQRLLDGGAHSVILASRNMLKLREAAKSLKSSSDQEILCCDFDLSDVKLQNPKLEEIQKMLKNKPLDGLVISSGMNFDGSNWKGFNISEADWDSVMNVNLKGAFFLL